jgi:hypothetical protein
LIPATSSTEKDVGSKEDSKKQTYITAVILIPAQITEIDKRERDGDQNYSDDRY